MIITLKGADFSKNNIGPLSSWLISREIGDGARYSGPTYVSKGGLYTATVVIAAGYRVAEAVSVTMNGVEVQDAITFSSDRKTLTITIAEVTGNVLVMVPTESSTSYYTVTYSYVDSNGIAIRNPETIQVREGTELSFDTNDAPSIDGYIFNSISHTNIVVVSDITIVYTYDESTITTFFTTGTAGGKKESTLYGFTWVMPKQFLTSRVNAITVPVYLYKDEYEYVDIICEIMEPQATGSTAAPKKKQGLSAITRMTADGNAVFNISFDASDIVADQCLIGVRTAGNKKIAFKDTTGTSAWKTATANTGSAKADPCCTYYATNAGAWAASNGVNTRYLELSTDKIATKYTLTAEGAEQGLARTSSNCGCIGGISSGADIYTNDILDILTDIDNILVVDDNSNVVDMPLTVTGNVSIAVLKVEEDGTFFENGTAGGGGSDNVSTTTFNGWLWPMPKKYITAPVSQVSAPSLVLRDTQVPVTITCELLDSNRKVIDGKTVTETVSNTSGGHDFNLAFTKDDIPGDWCYIAIYVDGESRTAGKVFGFDKVASTAEWYVEINNKTKYPPYYKNGTSNSWSESSSSNQRHIALKTSI